MSLTCRKLDADGDIVLDAQGRDLGCLCGHHLTKFFELRVHVQDVV